MKILILFFFAACVIGSYAVPDSMPSDALRGFINLFEMTKPAYTMKGEFSERSQILCVNHLKEKSSWWFWRTVTVNSTCEAVQDETVTAVLLINVNDQTQTATETIVGLGESKATVTLVSQKWKAIDYMIVFFGNSSTRPTLQSTTNSS